MARWSDHPGVRSDSGLSLGERAADAMRNKMGSWGFVFGAMVFLAAWMAYNGHHGFDQYPYILLNLILSCLAAMQGAILLIAAKRADQISSELAQHDFEADTRSKELLEQLTIDFATMAEQHRELHGQMAAMVAATGATMVEVRPGDGIAEPMVEMLREDIRRRRGGDDDPPCSAASA